MNTPVTKRIHMNAAKKNSVVKQTTEHGLSDTSTAYGVSQISRGQKKAARDVRRATIKLSKLGSQNEKGKWAEKDGLNARQKAKFEERQKELTGMKATRKRIMDMAKAGVDPTLSARFKSGTETKNVNLGTNGSDAGSTTGGENTEGENTGGENTEKKNIGTDTPVGTDTQVNKNKTADMSKGYSTSAMFAKKYTPPTSMLKKSGMKMGGFGSKTYKK
jgi:hypothetical protein